MVTTDIWDRVNNPQSSSFSNELWGKFEMKADLVGLVKGVGKEPFDPTRHKVAFTSIEVFIDPLPEMEIQNLNICTRNMLAESKEWRDITNKSIKDVGIADAREMIGKWIKAETVPTGDTYVKNGVTKDKTAIKLVQTFASEEECRKAYLGENDPFAPAPAATASPAAAPASPAAAPAQGRETGLKFLPVIVSNAWNKSGRNYDKAKIEVANMISGYPALAPYFTSDSPEVEEILMKLALS